MWSDYSGASLDVEGGEIMVLNLKGLESMLREQLALMEIVERACVRWEVESPIEGETFERTRRSLVQVEELLREGVVEVKLPINRG